MLNCDSEDVLEEAFLFEILSCSNGPGPQRSFKPCPLGCPQHGPLPRSCSLLTCITGRAFTGNFVLLFKKQNIATHLKAGILRTEWKLLDGALRPLVSEPCSANSSFQLHLSLPLLPLWVLDAFYFLHFSEPLCTAPLLC